MADRPGAARALPREGAARGEAQHELGRRRRALGGRGQALRDRPADARAVPRRLRAVRRASSPPPARARRSASSCCGSPRPACRTSTTATSCRTSRSSTPTTAGPVDWAVRRAALASRDAPHGDSAKLHVIREALALRAPPARGVRRRRLRAARRPARARAPTAAASDVVVAVPVRGDVPELDLPRGRWRNVLDGCRAGARRLPCAAARAALSATARTEVLRPTGPDGTLSVRLDQSRGGDSYGSKGEEDRGGGRGEEDGTTRRATTTTKAKAATEVTYEMIAERAYHIAESGEGGSDEENWHRAEAELEERVGRHRARRGSGRRAFARRRRPPCPPHRRLRAVGSSAPCLTTGA